MILAQHLLPYSLIKKKRFQFKRFLQNKLFFSKNINRKNQNFSLHDL